MQNKTLIIAGMHRSGTSLITQWLYRCGLHVGENLLGSGIGNDDGHYEDIVFYDFQRKLLTNKNIHDSGFTAECVPRLDPEEKKALKNIINRKNSLFEEWGWKDPRTCLFLRDYQELIPNAFYLVVFRDWRSTVSSMISRTYKVEYAGNEIIKKGWFVEFRKKRAYQKRIRKLCSDHASFFLRIWIFYNKEILDSIERVSKEHYTVINYNLLLKSDKAVFTQLKNYWKFALDYVNFKEIYKPGLLSKELNISKFVNRELIEEAHRLQNMLEKRSVFDSSEIQSPA
ncbi:hypothetical protein SAMN04487995_3017 [Dyadobacter koreensis]|uniref:Sulfotransferase family protein n=1 Tax=Dyadobacter koreensis TaxID=408657 RepID=A0A1H6V8W1_9BACT|nr:hypothetical protein [Dyadobacter koreensis]SEJ01079.1 hypothetical protein SAMN04487995_3017 [Dyadobacter koreensis]